VQWLDLAYLGAVKEQNGAAMSLGRTSTFLDIYFARGLEAGTINEQQAQKIIDDFVIKLRTVRFCEHQNTTSSSPVIPPGLLSRLPVLGTTDDLW
jgi:pyruvate-formate lyase